MAESWIGNPIERAWTGIRHRLSRPRNPESKAVHLADHGLVKVDRVLSFLGDNCLRTILTTKHSLDRAQAGTVLEICSDNLSAMETIPFMLQQCNCDHLATISEINCQKIYVRKRAKGPSIDVDVLDREIVQSYSGRESGK